MRELYDFLEASGAIYSIVTAVVGAIAVWYRRKITAFVVGTKGIAAGLVAIPKLQGDVNNLAEQFDMLMCTIRVEADAGDTVGRFDAGVHGGNTYVNQTYARWLGVGKSELLGWNFLNFVHPDDVDLLRSTWDTCRKEHRKMSHKVRLVPAFGGEFTVTISLIPVPDGPPAKKWIGSLRRVGYEAELEG